MGVDNGGVGCDARALSFEKKGRVQSYAYRGVLMPVTFLPHKEEPLAGLSPRGQLEDEVYEDEGDSEDSALRDEP